MNILDLRVLVFFKGSLMQEKEFVHIKELVEELLEKNKLLPKTLYGAWEEIVGSQAARYSRPHRKIGKILYVTVSNSIWKYHLELLKSEILEKLRDIEREKPIDDIRFRLGEINDDCKSLKAMVVKPASRKRRSRKKTINLRQLEKSDKELLAKIGDLKLRKVCRSFLRKIT